MSMSKLDPSQITRMTYDSSLEAVKVSIQSVDMSIELSAADGDNVTSIPNYNLIETTAATDAKGMKTVNLYVDAGAAASAKIQVSPVDSGNNWIDLPSSTTAQGAMSGPLSICARRVQVVVVTGTPVYHLVMQSV